MKKYNSSAPDLSLWEQAPISALFTNSVITGRRAKSNNCGLLITCSTVVEFAYNSTTEGPLYFGEGIACKTAL